jgi:alkanesulfonate monooxygenase SsuD/methylene tetrahydromethanopterin reductase-like flavin-dependent oxidoreductase (luciferase family)
MNQHLPEKSLGVIFHPTFPPESLAEYARRAEQAGFDELWLWDDCFLPGALTSAAIALQATRHLRVGIGLMPATVYNPLFAAMEITTLARAFPGRFLPGFGHGVAAWMEQIGAAPQSSLASLEETVTAVRRLLRGELVSVQGRQVRLDRVQMTQIPTVQPPLYVGAMRAKTLQLAGQVGDGTILTAMSSPEYVRWAVSQVRLGMAAAGRSEHRVVVFLDVKVGPDGQSARAAARRSLAGRLPWADVQLAAEGLSKQVAGFLQAHGAEGVAANMPDAWLDALAAAGTPAEAAAHIDSLVAAGADAVIFQPLDGDPDCLDEYARTLLPLIPRRGVVPIARHRDGKHAKKT